MRLGGGVFNRRSVDPTLCSACSHQPTIETFGDPPTSPPMNDRPSQAVATSPPMSPFREVWTIAWPTVLTMTSYTVMQFIDALMVGQVGPVELAAQSNGGMWAWALMAAAMGLL